MNTPQQVHRLSLEAYAALEKQLIPPFVQAGTTELQAGFMLGQQHVLKLLREGFTFGA